MNIQAIALVLVAATGCIAAEEPLETGEVESEITVWQWSDDVQIANQASGEQVGMATFGNLMMVHNGGSSVHDLWWTQWNGTSWSTNQRIPNQYAQGGPAVVLFDYQPTIIYRAWGENHLLMSRRVDQAWSPATIAGTALASGTEITSAPAATMHQGKLYVAACRTVAGSSRVHIERFNGTSWYAFGDLRPATPCRSVALASFEGAMHLIVSMREGAMEEWIGQVSTSGSITTWQMAPALEMKSSRPVSMVSCNGEVHLVHGGYTHPDELWWSYRWNGAWVESVRIMDQAANDGAALGCWRGIAMMVHNGESNSQLWASEFH